MSPGKPTRERETPPAGLGAARSDDRPRAARVGSETPRSPLPGLLQPAGRLCVVCGRVLDPSQPKVKGPYCTLACREADFQAAVRAFRRPARAI